MTHRRVTRDDIRRWSPQVQRIMRSVRLLEKLDPEAAHHVRTMVEERFERLVRSRRPRFRSRHRKTNKE
jgi:hypothetical protein